MDASRLLSGARWRLQYLARHSSRLPPVERQDIELTSTVGYKLSGRLTMPIQQGPIQPTGPLRGLVISPAIHQGWKDLEGWRSPISPQEIAALGYAVLSFDPAGRGQSWGEEDFGGPEHQDEVQVAARFLAGHPRVQGRVGILSLSMGLVAAAGALASDPELPVSWLLDWEGPCDREILTQGGTLMVPAAGHEMDDEDWWQPREAVRQIPLARCPYVRLQALPDHAQPQETRHATRMLRAVEPAGLPWFQLNDHPRGLIPDRPVWISGGPLSANRAILRKLKALRGAV